MKKKQVIKKRFENPLVNQQSRFNFKWIFGSSHFILGFFACLGVLFSASYLASFFSSNIFAFLFVYLILHLILALFYYKDQGVGEKFLVFFYLFSIISFAICVFLGFY